jgi:hypothetical protein
LLIELQLFGHAKRIHIARILRRALELKFKLKKNWWHYAFLTKELVGCWMQDAENHCRKQWGLLPCDKDT